MNLLSMQLPMGSIMTVCMLVAVLFATRLPVINVLQRSPRAIKWIVAFIVLAAGLWNAGWHAPRHIAGFWGQAALASGLLMIATALLIADLKSLPAWFHKARPFILLLLTGFMLLYGITIYRL